MISPDNSKISANDKKDGRASDHDYFAEWCQITGWHGVLDFHIAKHAAWKITWLTVVLGGCFFALNQTISMIMDYAGDDQWVTGISYETPKGGNMVWPNMTICPLNWPPILPNLAMEQPAADNTTSANGTDINFILMQANVSVTQMSTTESAFSNSTNVNEETDPLRYCEKVLLLCGNEKIKDSITFDDRKLCCNYSENSYDVYSTASVCFSVKPNAFFSYETRNQGNKLYYVLDGSINQDDLNAPLDASSGFEIRLYLGRSDAVDDFSSTFHVQPGTHNVISMAMEERRTTVKQGSIRFSKISYPCIFNKVYSFLKADEYSLALCEADCTVDWQIKFCGCYYAGYPIANFILAEIIHAKACANDTVFGLRCMLTYLVAQSTIQASDVTGVDLLPINGDGTETARCADQCPEPCNYRRVEARISNSLLMPPNKINKTLDSINQQLGAFSTRNYSTHELKQLTMIELYYEIKQVRVIEKSPRLSIDELISNIGGCLGVWSGISFLSIFQILSYLFRALLYYSKKGRGQRISQEQQKPVYTPPNNLYALYN